MEEDCEYRVVESDGKHLVVDQADQTLMTCGDVGSAQHYATLLNRAFRKGYKAGYREAKSVS